MLINIGAEFETRLFHTSGAARLFSYKHKSGSDELEEFSFKNLNPYAIEVNVSIQAGSGDSGQITYKGKQVAQNVTRIGWQDFGYHNTHKYLKGNLGRGVLILLNDVLKFSANGGAGQNEYLKEQRDAYMNIHTSKNIWGQRYTSGASLALTNWVTKSKEDFHNKTQGEALNFMITLKKNDVLSIRFLENLATNATNKGSFGISCFY